MADAVYLNAPKGSTLDNLKNNSLPELLGDGFVDGVSSTCCVLKKKENLMLCTLLCTQLLYTCLFWLNTEEREAAHHLRPKAHKPALAAMEVAPSNQVPNSAAKCFVEESGLWDWAPRELLAFLL